MDLSALTLAPTPSPFAALLLVVVGLVAGTINTIAGGGSLLTLPALIFLGLPPGVANATNRVGVLLQSSAAVHALARAERLPAWRDVGMRAVAACLGAAGGATLASTLAPEAFRRIIAVMMVAMLAVLLAQPKRWLVPRPAAPLTLQLLGFFAVGAYGGFLQAGVGLFLLAGSTLLCGENLVKGNGVKNLLVALFTVPALIVFAIQGLVAWLPSLFLAAGAIGGGFLGARLVDRLGAGFVRGVLVVVVTLSAVRLLLS